MKQHLLFPLLFIFFFLPSSSYSQGQTNIWYFGAFCGIDFNSGAPVTISGPINTLEGCASMCDSNGVLLFSTDGVNVFNSNNVVMASGLFGNSSSTQSAIITPFPGSLTKYYIFTVDAFGGSHGLNFSIVDMTLNGGLGAVISLNNQLVTPTCEKVTAVYGTNDTTIWVITHFWGSNEFYSFKVTPGGISLPVISSIGYITSGAISFAGYLKASPDGSKLAAAHTGSVGYDTLELYDFNNANGVVSNAVSIPSPFNDSYGVCFSPDNSKLYFSSYFSINAIYQYDLTDPNFATNPILIYNGGNIGFGAIQLAPDGKIYIAEDGTSSLSVISNPNGLGAACNFALNSFPILGTSHYGLPDFFDQLFITNCSVYLGEDTSICSTDPVQLNAGTGSGVNYLWQDGSTAQYFSVSGSGTYSVTKTYASGCIAHDTIEINFHTLPVINLGNDTVVCHPGTVTLNAGSGFAYYHWSNSTASQILIPLTTGNYSVIVIDSNNCMNSDTINVAFHGPQFSLGNDTTICEGDSVRLTPGSIYKTYQWSNSSYDSVIMVYGAGAYSVLVFDMQGCFARDTILVFVSTPEPDLGSDTLLCGTINHTLNTSVNFSQYHWNNNSTASGLNITTTGTYTVTVTDQYGCTGSDTIVVTNSNPQIELGTDTTICIHSTAALHAAIGFQSYLWNTGSNNTTITISDGGIYSITVTDSVSCNASDFRKIIIDDPNVSIGNDTGNCNGHGIILHTDTAFINYLWSTNSTDQAIYTTGAGNYAVTVTDEIGCKAADTILISYSDCQEIIVPTGFTPNGDGHNDYFHILNTSDFIYAGFKIYNRWGQLIYESSDGNGYWNGKFNNTECEVGVYVFVVSGKNFLNHSVFKKGNVTLLR